MPSSRRRRSGDRDADPNQCRSTSCGDILIHFSPAPATSSRFRSGSTQSHSVHLGKEGAVDVGDARLRRPPGPCPARQLELEILLLAAVRARHEEPPLIRRLVLPLDPRQPLDRRRRHLKHLAPPGEGPRARFRQRHRLAFLIGRRRIGVDIVERHCWRRSSPGCRRGTPSTASCCRCRASAPAPPCRAAPGRSSGAAHRGDEGRRRSPGNNWIGYIIHHAPGPMLAVQPTVELAKRFSQQRVDPLQQRGRHAPTCGRCRKPRRRQPSPAQPARRQRSRTLATDQWCWPGAGRIWRRRWSHRDAAPAGRTAAPCIDNNASMISRR